ncbi:excalibur calcium-binding domain-containing protein [Nocardia sp. NPDC051052]|uniref:excalibur calcium-binding domain-containing protein n=1 Tax=Nocardia sp. NPDC051052 TaxID=3364322 RepID=UPI0037879BEB
MSYSVMRRVAPAIGAACLVAGAIALVPSTAAAAPIAAAISSPDDSWPTPDRDGKSDDDQKKKKKRSAKIYTDCDQVRAEGAGPIYRGDPSYNSFLDQDGNGIACDD